MRALARARRFLKSTATKVEIVLITTMIIIQSGSCSYIIQFPVTGSTVLFSIVCVCVCVCVCVLVWVCACAIYTNSQHDRKDDEYFLQHHHIFITVLFTTRHRYNNVHNQDNVSIIYTQLDTYKIYNSTQVDDTVLFTIKTTRHVHDCTIYTQDKNSTCTHLQLDTGTIMFTIKTMSLLFTLNPTCTHLQLDTGRR